MKLCKAVNSKVTPTYWYWMSRTQSELPGHYPIISPEGKIDTSLTSVYGETRPLLGTLGLATTNIEDRFWYVICGNHEALDDSGGFYGDGNYKYMRNHWSKAQMFRIPYHPSESSR